MTGKSPLFRPESLEARRLAWLGRPIAHRSVPTAIMAGACLAIATVVVLILIFGEYTRRVPVAGVILPSEGLTRVVAPASGWISHQLKKEGEEVRQGDVIYVLGLDRATSMGNTQSEILDILRKKRSELEAELTRRAEIDAASKTALQDQVRDLQQEIGQAAEQLKLNEEYTQVLQSFVGKQQDFLNRGMSTSREYETRLQSWMAARSQVEALRRERLQLETKLSEAQHNLASFDHRAESTRGELRRQILDIETQISEGEARREIRVTAPRDGRITSVLAQAGHTVAAGAALATILPHDAALEAQLLAPSRAIGFIREGARVLLRYEAYPYQKFGQHGGTITLIAKAPLKADEAGIAASAAPVRDPGQSLYRIIIKPDRPVVPVYGRDEPLQVGMQLEAHILAETRPLYQWVLDPLYSLGRSVRVASASAQVPAP